MSTTLGDVLPLLGKHIQPASFLSAAIIDKSTYNSVGSDFNERNKQYGNLQNTMMNNVQIYTAPTNYISFIEITDKYNKKLYRFMLNLLNVTVYERLISKDYFNSKVFNKMHVVSMIPSIKLLILLKVYDMIVTAQLTNPDGLTTVYLKGVHTTQETADDYSNTLKEEHFVWDVNNSNRENKNQNKREEDIDDSEDKYNAFIVGTGVRKNVIEKLKNVIHELLVHIDIHNSPIFGSEPMGMTLARVRAGGASKSKNKAPERTKRHVMLPGKSRENIVYVKRGHEYVKVKGEFVTVKKAIADCASSKPKAKAKAHKKQDRKRVS